MNNLHQPEDIIGQKYRLIRLLGQGGMGTTYEAVDLENSHKVAIKVVSLRQMTDWKVLELFEREAKVLANLNHPAIPNYIDYFQADTPSDRCFYLVQELAVGESLAELVEGGWRTSETEVKDIALQVLAILEYLHSLKPPVIHRDIKPKNLLRQADGKIFLVDFGAVKDVYRNTLTRGGTFVGTLDYMPPEQLRGQACFASDLYSLGATLLYLLLGRSPAVLPMKRMKIDFRGQRSCASGDRVQISSHFADWLEKILEPVAEDRFATAKDATIALENEHLVKSPGIKTVKKPAGSKIRLDKSSDRLLINIPPTGLKIKKVLFALYWNVFLLFWTWVASQGSIFFALFSIPGWLVGLSMIFMMFFAISGSIRLEMTRNFFRLQWYLLGFPVLNIKGKTADINKTYIDVNISFMSVGSKSQKTITCAIREGVKTHKFGSLLTQVEKEWLVAEMSDFL